MLSTDIKQESIIKRIEQVVSILMAEDPLFKEDLDYSEIVKHLVKIVQDNLTSERFNNMSDEKLKENCSFVMATEVLSKIGEDFTPEQMATFDEAIKRK
ncbi:hypothetical protein [Dolichospermum compactum]|uniref:Uncharacterized protein n=1 Tax=Dolichospermum compactum NIES-806 TaxID=1973481 RepID=A0A1Z4V8Z9_9CYAN|nr:hypothetical protein [Dolichospermum compactum]BAZ87918.1 hypothetical protein NIES806_41500 [Dolichospermum compactum NIES-806]